MSAGIRGMSHVLPYTGTSATYSYIATACTVKPEVFAAVFKIQVIEVPFNFTV